MNISLLRKIQKVIDKNPHLFCMVEHKIEAECGTAYCIAGWACALSERLVGPWWVSTASMAAELLEFESKSIVCHESNRLFYEDSWPVQFQKDPSILASMETPEEAAARAIKRIEFFIQTNGTDRLEGNPAQ